MIGLLNSFFSAATAIVDERGGVVVNHVGDALIAAFNAPSPSRGIRPERSGRPRAPGARGGAGVRGASTACADRHCDRAVAAGTVGGAERQTYTVYGDTVNLAQRLEELNKEVGTNA